MESARDLALGNWAACVGLGHLRQCPEN